MCISTDRKLSLPQAAHLPHVLSHGRGNTSAEAFVALDLTHCSFHPKQTIGMSGWKAGEEPKRAAGTASSVAAIPHLFRGI